MFRVNRSLMANLVTASAAIILSRESRVQRIITATYIGSCERKEHLFPPKTGGLRHFTYCSDNFRLASHSAEKKRPGLSKRLIAADRNPMTITLVGKIVPKRLVLRAAIVPKCD